MALTWGQAGSEMTLSNKLETLQLELQPQIQCKRNKEKDSTYFGSSHLQPKHKISGIHCSLLFIIWSLTLTTSCFCFCFFSRLQPEIPVGLPKVLQSFQLFSTKLGQSWNQHGSGCLCFLPCFFPPSLLPLLCSLLGDEAHA